MSGRTCGDRTNQQFYYIESKCFAKNKSSYTGQKSSTGTAPSMTRSTHSAGLPADDVGMRGNDLVPNLDRDDFAASQ